jgi:UTP--glucose-1-phosphate uridylyltransferase
MMDLYAQTGQSVVLCEEVPQERTQNYGVLDLKGALEGQKAAVRGFVEKPKPADAPSNLAVVGRYIITPRHFDHLSEKMVGKGGEIQLTDAMAKVCQEEGYWGWVSKNPRFDCGDKVGFQMANLYFAMRDPEIGPRLLPFLQQTASQYERRKDSREA